MALHSLHSCIFVVFIPKTSLIHLAMGNCPSAFTQFPKSSIFIDGELQGSQSCQRPCKHLNIIADHVPYVLQPCLIYWYRHRDGNHTAQTLVVFQKNNQKIPTRTDYPTHGLRVNTDRHYCQHYHSFLFYLLFPFSMSLSQAGKQI